MSISCSLQRQDKYKLKTSNISLKGKGPCDRTTALVQIESVSSRNILY